MKTEDFAAQYQALTDDDITQLANEGGLRPEADIALRGEMRRRSIGAKEVESSRVKQERAKLQMQVGRNPSYRGVGLRLRGHKFLSEADKNNGIVVVTRWIVFLYMSLIPLGSYRVIKSAYRKATIVSKVQLQWDQVLVGWMQTGSVVILVACLLLWLRWFDAR